MTAVHAFALYVGRCVPGTVDLLTLRPGVLARRRPRGRPRRRSTRAALPVVRPGSPGPRAPGPEHRPRGGQPPVVLSTSAAYVSCSASAPDNAVSAPIAVRVARGASN